jgi:adenosylhomocysteine nucleosidase
LRARPVDRFETVQPAQAGLVIDMRAAPQKLGFVTGLAAEARLLRKFPVLVEIGGGTSQGALHAAERLIRRQATALVSFGLAGGLDPVLPPGTIIIPQDVLSGATRYTCDAGLRARLGGTTHPLLLAGPEVAATMAQKSAWHKETEAAAIDLESGAVAAIAATYRLPFAVLRAIADPAGRALPAAALLALDAEGQIALLPAIRSLLGNPAQIPGLIGLARDASTARQALIRWLHKTSASF